MGKLKVQTNWLESPSVPMGGKFLMPAKFTVVYEDSAGEPGYEMDFEVRNGAPECRAVRISSSADGSEVQRKHLRMLSIDDHLEYAVSAVGMVIRTIDPVSGEITADNARDDAEVDKLIRQGRLARAESHRSLTDDMLREVAEIYRANVDTKPIEAVAAHFDKQHRTAQLYVKRARDAGFLGAALKGKAGER
ncbi:MAG: hypothetical protein M3492_11175 [Actinomycetota bacterium]|nr:hypothetical protein [Actinomycetota bacterium]